MQNSLCERGEFVTSLFGMGGSRTAPTRRIYSIILKKMTSVLCQVITIGYSRNTQTFLNTAKTSTIASVSILQ